MLFSRCSRVSEIGDLKALPRPFIDRAGRLRAQQIMAPASPLTSAPIAWPIGIRSSPTCTASLEGTMATTNGIAGITWPRFWRSP